jgi:hypothetical protein
MDGNRQPTEAQMCHCGPGLDGWSRGSSGQPVVLFFYDLNTFKRGEAR